MATKSGTSQFHGAAYDYVRNAALNANLYFDKQATPVIPRPIYTQNQYGVAVGGPVLKDKAFFYLSWEQFDLTRGLLISTQVPTAAMLGGDFSAVPTQLYDPNNQICAAGGSSPRTGTSRCAYTAANGYVGSGPGQIPGAANQIPVSEIPQATLLDGGGEWGGPAVDPKTGVFYVNANDTAWLVGLTAPPPAGSLGERTYQKQCAICHGQNWAGSPPSIPALCGIDGILTDAEIAATIRQGRGRMPPFSSLRDDEIESVVQYLTKYPQQQENRGASGEVSPSCGEGRVTQQGAPLVRTHCVGDRVYERTGNQILEQR